MIIEHRTLQLQLQLQRTNNRYIGSLCSHVHTTQPIVLLSFFCLHMCRQGEL